MKKFSQIKYGIIIKSTLLNPYIRSRKKDAISDFQKGDHVSWEENKKNGYRVVRLRITEES